jgi:hypothetical protein
MHDHRSLARVIGEEGHVEDHGVGGKSARPPDHFGKLGSSQYSIWIWPLSLLPPTTLTSLA